MRQTRVVSVLVAAVAGTLLAVAAPAMAATATATTTTLTSSANPSTAGQPVTLTATVTGDSPTGQVDFADAGVVLGSSVDLTSGVATLTLSSLSVGDHALTVTYNGDPNNLGSQGALTQAVAAPPAPPGPPTPAPVATVKPPTVKLAASTTKTSVGDQVRLSWRTKHADSVRASGDWRGARAAKGSVEIRLTDRGKHVFKLRVQNTAGSRTATVKVLAARKAKALQLVVSDELTMVGSAVDVTADGLARGEEYTIRLDGKPILTGKADKRGEVARTFTLATATAEGALPLTITGSNPGRLGSSVLNVIKPKKLDVQLLAAVANKRAKQTVTVTGLAAGETVTVVYRDKELTTGTADADGQFTYEFGVGKKAGKQTVKVTGAQPSRTGTASFTVLDQVGGGGGGRGGKPSRL
jgi:hypothetical protein